jgi:hypothetical protein
MAQFEDFKGANEYLKNKTASKVIKDITPSSTLHSIGRDTGNLQPNYTSLLNEAAYSVQTASNTVVSKIKSILNIGSKKVGHHNELPWTQRLGVDWSPLSPLTLDSSYFRDYKEVIKSLPKEHGSKIFERRDGGIDKSTGSEIADHGKNNWLNWLKEKYETRDIVGNIPIDKISPAHIQWTTGETENQYEEVYYINKNNFQTYRQKNGLGHQALAGISGGLIRSFNSEWVKGVDPSSPNSLMIKEVTQSPIKSRKNIDEAKNINNGYFNFRITNTSNDTYEIFPAYIRALNEGINVTWNQTEIINKSEPEFSYANAVRNFSLEFVIFANSGGTIDVPQRSEDADLWNRETDVENENINHKPIIKWMKYRKPDQNDISTFGYKFYRDFEKGFASNVITIDEMYRKINFLHTCCYPAYQQDRLSSYPFCKLLLANLYTDIMFIVDSVSVNYTPLMWGIYDSDTPIAPIIAEVSLSGRFIHRRVPNSNYIFY